MIPPGQPEACKGPPRLAAELQCLIRQKRKIVNEGEVIVLTVFNLTETYRNLIKTNSNFILTVFTVRLGRIYSLHPQALHTREL